MVALSGFFSSLPLPHLVFVILTLWKGSETWEASTFPKERGFELTLGGGEEAAFGCHSQGVTKPFLPFFPRCPSSGRKLRQLVPLGTSGGHKLGLSHSTLFLSGLTLLEENRQFPASYLLQCVCVCGVCMCVYVKLRSLRVVALRNCQVIWGLTYGDQPCRFHWDQGFPRMHSALKPKQSQADWGHWSP